jgi:hypothetical protein
VDKNCRIGRGVKIGPNIPSECLSDNEGFSIVDGVAIVERGTTLPHGWAIP